MGKVIAEVIISHAELIYVLHRIKAKNLVGMELKEFSLPNEKLDEILELGLKSLISRSVIDPKTLEISSELIDLVRAIGFREFAVILVRGIRGKGKQIYIFNFYGNSIVEHTQPEENKHRLKVIASFEDFINRIEQLVPIKPVFSENRLQYHINTIDFERIQDLSIKNPEEARQKLLSNGVSESSALLLLSILSNPILTFSIACLVVKKNTIVEANSVAIFADEISSWGVWSSKTTKNKLDWLIMPTGINDVKMSLIKWLEIGNPKV